MDFIRDFYTKYFGDLIPFDMEYDLNYTCNVFLTKNMTLIRFDRGWEGIPESLVIQLVLCLFMILPFVIFRYLAQIRSDTIKRGTYRTNWIEFIYGDRDIKKKPIGTKNFNLIENYFRKQEYSQQSNILPHHLSSCKNQRPKKHSSYGSTNLANSASPSSSASTTSSSSTVTTTTTSDSNASIKASNDISIIKTEQDNNCTLFITEPDLNGSKSNLVEVETTFPSSRCPAYTTQLSVDFRSHSVNFIERLSTRLLGISDEDILKNKGQDAHQYLLFQRHIIVFLFILSLVNIFIILPINYTANNEGRAFARTSVSNVPKDSNLYWAHAICSSFIVVVGIFLMHHFSSSLKTDDDMMFIKTLLIRRIPIVEELVDKLQLYFRTRFTNRIRISGIQLITDVRQLDSLEQSYTSASNALKYCEEINNSNEINTDDDKRFMIRPYNFSQLGCCCCKKEHDGAQFYSLEKEELTMKIHDELKNISSRPARSAFITFETEQMAMEVYQQTKKRQNVCTSLCSCFRDGDQFDLVECIVSYAPYPDDVNWRDIAYNMNLLWLRKFMIFTFLFIIFFFLSTPAFLLKIFDLIATKELIKKGILKPNSIISDFLSPFLLMLLAIILPSIVTFACQMIPYKTISDLNHAVMSKVFAFLVMMIIILPSTGFLSMNAMLGAILMPSADQKEQKFRWHCLFPVDNGAFFVIYTTQAAILGNVAEILRIPELILYFVYTLFLRSPAEYEKARKWVTFDFPFGVSYPRFLLIFTMTIIYSFACPLIAPCGLIYMSIKHLVDRYNIYYVYQPTKINRRIHSKAILYVHIGLILMQFQLFTVMLVKTQYSHVTLFVLITFLISLLTLVFYLFVHWFRNINPITKSINTRGNYKQRKRDFCVCSYTPPVLYNLLDDGIFKED